MAPMISMKTNQIRYLGFGGCSAIHAEMTRSTVFEAARTTHLSCPIVRLAALSIAAPALLASQSQIKNLGSLAQAL